MQKEENEEKAGATAETKAADKEDNPPKEEKASTSASEAPAADEKGATAADKEGATAADKEGAKADAKDAADKPPGTDAKVENKDEAKEAKADTGAKVADEAADTGATAATSASGDQTMSNTTGYQNMSNTTGYQTGLNTSNTQNPATSQNQTDESQSQSVAAVAEGAYGDQDTTGNGQNPYNGQSTGNGQNPYNGQSTGNGQNPYNGQSTGNGQNPYNGQSTGNVQGTSRGRDQKSISGDFASINFTIGTSTAENNFLKEMLECQMKINEQGGQISMDEFFRKLHDCEIQNITKHKISNGFDRLIENYNGKTITSLTEQQVNLIQTLTGICGGGDSGFVDGTTLNSSQFIQYINTCVQNNPTNKEQIQLNIKGYLDNNPN
jgi:hypothetical protein